MCRSGCWLVRQVVRESDVATVGQSVTASRYVDCIVPCKSVEVEERLGLCRTYRAGAKALPCQSCADDGYGLVRAKAVRTYRTGAKALSCQSRADESDGSEGFVVLKPCGRIGRERRLCRVKAVRSMAMARFAPKPCRRADRSEGFVVSKPCRRIGRERRLCRVKAVRTSRQARRSRLRWALS